MFLGPYTIFHKAADRLVKELMFRRTGEIDSSHMIMPVEVILYATMEEIKDIHSPYLFRSPSGGLVLSNISDIAGTLPELENQMVTVKISKNLIEAVKISKGDQVKVNALITISPNGSSLDGMYPIKYVHDSGIAWIGVHSITEIVKILG